MKLLPIVTALFALLPLTFHPVQAQNNTTLERLMSTDGITVVYLSSSMLSESSLRFSGGNGHSASLHGLIQAVNSVYIFSAHALHLHPYDQDGLTHLRATLFCKRGPKNHAPCGQEKG